MREESRDSLVVVSGADTYRKMANLLDALDVGLGQDYKVLFEKRILSVGDEERLGRLWPQILFGGPDDLALSDDGIVLALPPWNITAVAGIQSAVALLISDPRISEVTGLTFSDCDVNGYAYVEVDKGEGCASLFPIENTSPSWNRWGSGAYTQVSSTGGPKVVRTSRLATVSGTSRPLVRALSDPLPNPKEVRLLLSSFGLKVAGDGPDSSSEMSEVSQLGLESHSRWRELGVEELVIHQSGVGIRDDMQSTIWFHEKPRVEGADGRGNLPPNRVSMYFRQPLVRVQLGPSFEKIEKLFANSQEGTDRDWGDGVTAAEIRLLQRLRRIRAGIPHTIAVAIERILERVIR